MPPRPVERDPHVANRGYNSDEIKWTQHRWQEPENSPNVALCFYKNLHTAITENKPLFVTPESVGQQIRILNRCHELCPTEFEVTS